MSRRLWNKQKSYMASGYEFRYCRSVLTLSPQGVFSVRSADILSLLCSSAVGWQLVVSEHGWEKHVLYSGCSCFYFEYGELFRWYFFLYCAHTFVCSQYSCFCFEYRRLFWWLYFMWFELLFLNLDITAWCIENTYTKPTGILLLALNRV